MAAVVLLALASAVALAAVILRYASGDAVRTASPGRRKDPERPRMRPAQLRQLVVDLLDAIGLTIVEEEVHGDERRLVVAQVTSEGRFFPTRYVVFVEPTPPDDVVAPPCLVELSEYVKAGRAALGMLVTPYRIADGAPAGAAPLDLVDGLRLRQLVEKYLPQRASDLERYRGFQRLSIQTL